MTTSNHKMTTPCYKNRMDSNSKLTTENTRMTSSFLIIVIVTSVFLSTQIPRISAQDGGYYVAAGTRILFVKAPNTDVIYEDSLSKIITVAYDGYEVSGKGLLFWSDISVSRKRIFKAKIEKAPDITEEGTLEMNINVDAVTGLALDWRTNNIYFTSEKDQTISACAYTYADFSARCKVIIFTDLQRPRGITLDLDASYLFWSDQKTMKVERSMLDGSNRTTLVTNAQLPNHMVTHRSKLYWLNSDNKTLERCDYSGSNHIIVASLKNLVEDTHIFGLSVLNRLSGNPGIGPNNNNFPLPPTPTPAPNIPPPTSAPSPRDEFIITTLGKLMVRVVVPLGQDCGVAERYMSYAKASALFGVAHYNGVLNQTGSSNVCTGNSVDLLCFPVNGAAVYACPSHSLLFLDPSARACIEPTRILLFAMADQGVVAMVGNPRSVAKAELHIHVKFVRRSSRPIAVAYDDYRQVVFWSDVTEHGIYRGDLRSSKTVPLLTANDGIGLVDALVYYSQQCLLFYTNVGSVTINQVKYNWHTLEVLDVCDVNGPKKVRVLTRSGQKLRGLAINGNFIYFTDWGEKAALMRMDIDGENLIVIKSGFENPNAVYFYNNMLYVLDSHYKSKKDGSLVKINTKGVFQSYINKNFDLKTPFSMAVDTDDPFHIYITDWTLRRITRSVFDPSGANLPISSVFFEGFDGLTGLVVGNLRSSYAPSGSCIGLDERICFTPPKFVCKSKFLDQTSRKCSLSKNFVAIADLNSIKFMNLDPVAPSSEINHVMTVVQGDSYMANIVALAYYNESLIYFNIFDNTFNSLNLVTFLTTPIYRVNHIVESMLQHDNVLYWSDSNYGLICYLSLLNPSSGHKILRRKLSQPRDLAILRGELYWTEWGKSPKVAKIALPDSASSVKETVIVIPSPLANLSLTWPNGLVFDGATDAMYVGDGFGATKKILKVQFDFSVSPPAMSETQLMDDITHIYDIAFINQNIFYTDMLTGSLNVIPLATGRSSVVIDDLIRPSQFVIRYTTAPSSYCNPVVKNKVCGSDPNVACKSILGSMVECSCVDQVNYVYVKSSKTCALRRDSGTQCLKDRNSTFQYLSILQPDVCKSCECQGMSYTYGDSDSLLGFVCGVTECPVLNCLPDDEQLILDGNCCKTCKTNCMGVRFRNCPKKTLQLILPPNGNFTNDDFVGVAEDCTGMGRDVQIVRDPPGVIMQWQGGVDPGGQLYKVILTASVSEVVANGQVIPAASATCQYTVKLVDKTPPTIECPADVVLSTYDNLVDDVRWAPPKIRENVEFTPPTSNPAWGSSFKVGSTRVDYTVTDTSESKSSCSFEVKVNKMSDFIPAVKQTTPKIKACFIKVIINGHYNCRYLNSSDPNPNLSLAIPNPTDTNPVLKCSTVCNEGYSVNGTSDYYCYDGAWIPEMDTSVERYQCLRVTPKTLVGTQDVYLTDKCREAIDQDFTLNWNGGLYKNTFYSVGLKKRLKIQGCSKNVKTFQKRSERRVRRKTRETWKRKRRQTSGHDNDVRLMYQLLEPVKPENRNASQVSMSQAMRDVVLDLHRGFTNILVNNAKDGVQNVFDLTYGNGLSFSYGCEPGEVERNDSCVHCPPGSMQVVDRCIDCPEGTFNPEDSSDSCQPCPPNHNSPAGSYVWSQCYPVQVPAESCPRPCKLGLGLGLGLGGGLLLLLALIIIPLLCCRKRALCCWKGQSRKGQEFVNGTHFNSNYNGVNRLDDDDDDGVADNDLPENSGTINRLELDC